MGLRTGLFGVVLAAFAVLAAPAAAAPLSIANVGAPAVNCVFNPACTVTVADTIGNFPPHPGYTGVPVLQSRTYAGAPGTAAAGLTAYVYRVDFSAASPAADMNCAVWMKVDFGPHARLRYTGLGPNYDVFVVTSGGLGTVGLASASRAGTVITFNFAAPVCPGQSSDFFGVAAKGPPKPDAAKVLLTYGGGVVSVPARRPSY